MAKFHFVFAKLSESIIQKIFLKSPEAKSVSPLFDFFCLFAVYYGPMPIMLSVTWKNIDNLQIFFFPGRNSNNFFLAEKIISNIDLQSSLWPYFTILQSNFNILYWLYTLLTQFFFKPPLLFCWLLP